MDAYKKLQERLDAHPATAPASESFERILKILFTPEEVAILNYLTFTLQPVSKLAEKSGIGPETLTTILESIADRGLVYAKPGPDGKNRYSLLPTIPGLFEIPFMRSERLPQKQELGRLWQQYHTEALGNSFAGAPTPQMRVIPVQQAIPMISEVVPYDVVSEMINESDYIGLTNCACRVSIGACDKPVEVCLTFDDMAHFLVGRGHARSIDKKEALKVLQFAEEEGLVHCINNAQDRPNVICNCCGCCCTLLRGITELNNPNSVATSRYVIEYTPESCIGCHLCVERCPVKAIDENDDLVDIDKKRCIGCGLCVSTCPTESLHLKLREDVPVVLATKKELFMKVLKEKDRLKAFMTLNQE